MVGAVLLAVTLGADAAIAQRGGGGAPAPLPRNFYEDRLSRQGDKIIFCVNQDAMMADFERDLARLIGEVLLVEVEIYDVDPPLPTIPLDYRLPLLPEQIFLVLIDDCDAMFGFALAGSYRDWITLSRPYLDTRMVLVVADPAIAGFTDIPRDGAVGTRAMSNGDIALITYLQALPASNRWQRIGYFTNEILLERLRDGTVGGAVMWEPAVHFATEGDPASAGLRILPLPFVPRPTQLGLAMLAEDLFLRTALDEAIAVLVADGAVEALAVEHHLRPVPQ
ncbi:MAG: transporter substrate-binding domain-containing protein [Bauldia sp.]|nr:transporter substrate-binding domain-containing protein [Bauldia sp.]